MSSGGSHGLPGFVRIPQQQSRVSGGRLSYKPSAPACTVGADNLGCYFIDYLNFIKSRVLFFTQSSKY